MEISQSNKRIAKNTIALYFRQIISMAVTLYTSRLILETLGVIDYGIYNVVGGLVAFFNFFTTSLTNITQRFISVELGKTGNLDNLKKIFSTSIILHIIACLIVIIIGESLGLWFLNTKLIIPNERLIAANWVYQFVVFGFVLSLFHAPFMALIFSHEDIHIYGYMGIIDVIARLLTVYFLIVIRTDKLILFSLISFIITLSIAIFYIVFCNFKYQEAKFTFVINKSLIKNLSSFGGYIFVNNIFSVLLNQGINVLMNLFFGPAINAARGLANSVNSAMMSFANNFIKTLVPQITKSYASNDFNITWKLVERGTRMYYFLFLFFLVPVLLETDFILKLWLKNVPDYTSIFVKLMIINALISMILSTYWNIVNASGKLKIIYCSIYIINILILCFSYLICKLGFQPQYVFLIPIIITILITYPVCFSLAKKILNFPIKYFFQKAIFPILIVTIISFLPFFFVSKLISSSSSIRSIVIIIISMFWTGLIILIIGLTKNERIKIINIIKVNILK